ncbi:MAG: MATE family efflux transporter [Cellulosilyticaceae bacterium]
MKQLIGDKKFYKMVLTIAIPIIIQNGVTNFVGFLDNMMVGQVGTNQMSGVAIVNQLLFVFNLCIFGAVSGAGIFVSQFWGQKNYEGMRDAFRFKMIVCGILTVIGISIFALLGPQLISLYLHEGNDSGQVIATLNYGKEYLVIMLIGLVPFAIGQVYASTLRERGETILPMKAGITSVCVNTVLNILLIFGYLGFPNLGIKGAAIATVIARIVECTIIVTWTHYHKEDNPFVQGAYHNFVVPADLMKQIIKKGAPLLMNEALWAAGTAMLMQCYSVRGLEVVAGLNIAQTIANLFNVVFIALGSAVAIIVGPLLGAGKMEEAEDTAYKMIFFSVVSCFVLGACMLVIAPMFPAIYNTSDQIKALATAFIRIGALCMPIFGFLHATYFTIRSGGRTFITFLFDSVFLWVVSVPLAFALTRYTGMPIVAIYFGCQLVDLLKCGIGYAMLKKGIWIQNIVEDIDLESELSQ